MFPFVSIIIPVYNAEKTLSLCINSILSQTDDDYEVVIVDDGSTDGSLSLCRQFEKERPSFTVLHQENAGVSAARNNGVAQASGEYIFFIDADDYIEPGTIAQLKEACSTSNFEKRYDICFFGYIIEEENHKCVKRISPISYRGPKNPQYLLGLMQRNLLGLACNKIIRRELIRSCEISFTIGKKVFEDQEFLMKIWNASSMLVCIDRELYHYVQTIRSTMKRTTSDSLESFLKLKNENLCCIKNFMKINSIEEKEIDSYLFFCSSSEVGQILKLLMSLPNDKVHEEIKKVKDGAIGQIISKYTNKLSIKEKIFLDIINKDSVCIRLKLLKAFCLVTGYYKDVENK